MMWRPALEGEIRATVYSPWVLHAGLCRFYIVGLNKRDARSLDYSSYHITPSVQVLGFRLWGLRYGVGGYMGQVDMYCNLECKA